MIVAGPVLMPVLQFVTALTALISAGALFLTAVSNRGKIKEVSAKVDHAVAATARVSDKVDSAASDSNDATSAARASATEARRAAEGAATSAVDAATNAALTSDKVDENTAITHAVSDKVDAMDLKLNQVHKEVRTMNGLTVGELADQDETRRISDIAVDDRTVKENQHIAAIPAAPKKARAKLAQPVKKARAKLTKKAAPRERA